MQVPRARHFHGGTFAAASVDGAADQHSDGHNYGGERRQQRQHGQQPDEPLRADAGADRGSVPAAVAAVHRHHGVGHEQRDASAGRGVDLFGSDAADFRQQRAQPLGVRLPQRGGARGRAPRVGGIPGSARSRLGQRLPQHLRHHGRAQLRQQRAPLRRLAPPPAPPPPPQPQQPPTPPPVPGAQFADPEQGHARVQHFGQRRQGDGGAPRGRRRRQERQQQE